MPTYDRGSTTPATLIPASRPDIGAVRTAVLSGRTTPTEVVRNVFDRIGEVDHVIHSMLDPAQDRAYAIAARLERDVADGRAPGPLFGVPFTVKGTESMAGLSASYGSLARRHEIAPHDGPVVQRLIAAGAIPVGLSNLPEFTALPRTANRLGPECVNPHDPTRIAGGSSGGAAAGVAAGIVPFAVGTDTGGSNRVPAAFCGVVGVAPTPGAVHDHHGYRSSPELTVVGPVAGSVRDVALVNAVLTGSEPMRVACNPDAGPMRIRWMSTSGLDDRLDPHVAAMAFDALDPAGRVERETSALATAELFDAFALMVAAGRAAQLRPLLADPDARALLTDTVLEQVEAARAAHATDYAAAVRQRSRAAYRLSALMHDADVIATPTVGFVAPPVEAASAPTAAVAFTFIANFAGFPALSLPCGFVGDMPVGVQLIARPGAEHTMVDVAEAVEHSVGRLPEAS
ncbi:amidase [Rudaeicoccus suwonensis]|uniref:Amidase/aspartyl-tRNA(Asn)/glutamyl-tRNA(Gln) amidotransferase subunit A n=1 Tax=Rudaeicoccus suwonensis TaxID=657409 RepID=A0A561EB79_9MICO|nr:amidase [Rudaeicoccus suwonensis]TWE12858.1 amidase/aspartyl-tRNA(Asn)/glutamyl-tRNA(Gln) amidotransferase subunit A [Rudaeicoccus suwonensis]